MVSFEDLHNMVVESSEVKINGVFRVERADSSIHPEDSEFSEFLRPAPLGIPLSGLSAKAQPFMREQLYSSGQTLE